MLLKLGEFANSFIFLSAITLTFFGQELLIFSLAKANEKISKTNAARRIEVMADKEMATDVYRLANIKYSR